ncbi:ATP-binding cassette, subfamily G (WHITE), member 2, PDR, partial [Lecanoromycetidae sp. Uapishka_2]
MTTTSSAGPWGAIPQSEGVAHAVESAVEKVGENLPQSVENQIPFKDTSYNSSDTDTSSDLEKIGSTREVAKLARQLTQQSEHAEGRDEKLARLHTARSIKDIGGNYRNSFIDQSDPALDPTSGQFRPEAWVRTLIGIQSRDPERYPQRVAGVAYKNLNVHGFGSLTDYQKTFGNYPLEVGSLFNKISGRGKHKIQILRDFEGLVHSGEMLVVLGRPGSGCSTLLKTIAGETHGFFIDEHSDINYQGIPKEAMHKDFRGECMYQAEVDVHFPQLTVGQTLNFAAQAKAPRNRIPGVTREQYAKHMTEVIMAVFGLSHTYNTKVGNDFVRGVSGGERKRVSIAEAALGGSPLQCWDNSTRGLDSATALEFVKTLRISSSLAGSTAAVAIYQASQSIYDIFDKVVVLYEGRQIYFGPTTAAKDFFVNMGFVCTERATTGDFLTSLTNPAERIIREGFEHRVPRTPDEFAAVWQKSDERARLLQDIEQFNNDFPVGGEHLEKFQQSRKATMAKRQRPNSPYTISVPMQVRLCTQRGFQRLRGDASIALSGIIGNSVMALIIGSVFYNLADDTGSFYSRDALLFFAILLNAFSSFLEVRYVRFRWINYLDPVAYAFEALMINEFHDRQFPCSNFIPSGPGYSGVAALEHVCSTVGSMAGVAYVEGDAYINASFSYYRSHLWRNLGILIAEMIAFCGAYLTATEFISSQRSKGEVLLFRRGVVPAVAKQTDEEAKVNDRPTPEDAIIQKTNTEIPATIQKQTAIFHWQGVNYDIKIKGGGRRLLDDVDGWVKPGTLTALMGASGAGKTTLLDVLASRVTMGVVSGQMLVNGRQRDSGFQRKTGYVQQQDLHLATTTVREALNFSALLRQPKTTPKKEKLEYVDEVIKVLEMEGYADAIVGVPGEGLNVEQRKRLTIGVELAAKPALLLFLDEPTSGLDSQTAWSICTLLRKLANNGQAILCTIHQPSAVLFQEFDRLLFLASGGRTVYFGDIGSNSKVLTSYFERNGSRQCSVEENPAEWMLDVIGAAPGSQNTLDWPQIWRDSEEKQMIRETLAEMKPELKQRPVDNDPTALREFAESFTLQLYAVTKRVFEQYWRTPSYLYSKTLLCTASALFIGFSFWDSAISLQGLQNQLFSIFMLMTIFGNIVQQTMPHFVTQRALYESRERPSKAYSWKVFMLSNIAVELPWNTLMAVLIFFCFYYPIGMYKNAIPDHQVHERGALMFLLVWTFLLFTSTFTDMIVAGIETAETAGNIAQLLFSLTLIFCGVLAGPSTLPGFWIFMYRVSPFTYLIDGMLSTGLANNAITCSSIELVTFNPTPGQTCGHYMADYISTAGGYLTNAAATANCQFCSASSTNVYLEELSSQYSTRWRNFGIMWAFIIFNICGALFLYWLARVPRKQKVQEEAPSEPISRTQTNVSRVKTNEKA